MQKENEVHLDFRLFCLCVMIISFNETSYEISGKDGMCLPEARASNTC